MSSGGNRAIQSSKECEILAGVTLDIKARVVTVKGKRGTLTRDFKHLNVEIYKSKNAKTGKDVVVVSPFTGRQRARRQWRTELPCPATAEQRGNWAGGPCLGWLQFPKRPICRLWRSKGGGKAVWRTEARVDQV